MFVYPVLFCQGALLALWLVFGSQSMGLRLPTVLVFASVWWLTPVGQAQPFPVSATYAIYMLLLLCLFVLGQEGPVGFGFENRAKPRFRIRDLLFWMAGAACCFLWWKYFGAPTAAFMERLARSDWFEGLPAILGASWLAITTWILARVVLSDQPRPYAGAILFLLYLIPCLVPMILLFVVPFTLFLTGSLWLLRVGGIRLSFQL